MFYERIVLFPALATRIFVISAIAPPPMVDVGTVLIAIVAGIASLFMTWTIGAGSSESTPFAPAVGAHAIPVMRVAFLVGILAFWEPSSKARTSRGRGLLLPPRAAGQSHHRGWRETENAYLPREVEHDLHLHRYYGPRASLSQIS